MSESYREQHPLLYEDLSEEEQFSPRFQRRFRPMVLRSRVRNKVKGAAAIIKFWPDHWSSSVAYWWLGIGMIALTTFIVYNIVATVTLLPPSPLKMHMRTLNDAVTPTIGSAQYPINVYMHLFVQNDKEVDLNSYLPYIDIIANKYADFKYHLIIVHDDTTVDTDILSAEENNENALHLLWATNNVHLSSKNNVVIEHMTLSKYMDKSPLRKHWKRLPRQFIEFLTRAVSIWDKGGIALNPTILTPRSPHAIYIEKIQNLLKNFNHISQNASKEQKTIKHTGLKKKVNNIRDIIDALEHDSSENASSPDQAYTDAKNAAKTHPKQILEVIRAEREENVHYDNHHVLSANTRNNITFTDNIKVPDPQETLVMAESKSSNSSVQATGSINNGTYGILPMFLEFLFRNKPGGRSTQNVLADDKTTLVRKRKHVLPSDDKNDNRSTDQVKLPDNFNREVETHKALVIPAKPIHVKNESVIETYKDKTENINQVTIDLKGNIVSSEVPCHAFLGTIFSNVIHSNPQESLTDFIIAELSIFCKGVLSSCNGIDVILL